MYNILHYFTCCFKGTKFPSNKTEGLFKGTSLSTVETFGFFKKKKQENQPLVEDFEIQHIYLNPDVEL